MLRCRVLLELISLLLSELDYIYGAYGATHTD